MIPPSSSGAILATATVVFSVDRAEREGTGSVACYALALAGGFVTIAIVVLALWAMMTQK